MKSESWVAIKNVCLNSSLIFIIKSKRISFHIAHINCPTRATSYSAISSYFRLFPTFSQYFKPFQAISCYFQLFPCYFQLCLAISSYFQLFPNYFQLFPNISSYFKLNLNHISISLVKLAKLIDYLFIWLQIDQREFHFIWMCLLLLWYVCRGI